MGFRPKQEVEWAGAAESAGITSMIGPDFPPKGHITSAGVPFGLGKGMTF